MDSLDDSYSLTEIGLVAGGKERKDGRQTIFFTPLDPFNSDANETDPITDLKKPRKVKYQSPWRPEQDAVYWIHLSTVQDAGLEFWRTSSNAMITYQSVPKESVVKVVSGSGKRELFARQLTPRERPKVTLGPSWIYDRSNTVSMPRETESNLQAWNSNPKSSERRKCPNEEQLPWCDGSMRSTDDARRTGVSATTDHLPGFPDPDSERGATTRWPVRLVILNGQHDNNIDPNDLEGQQKHIENEELQVVNGSRHLMMDLRSRTLRRLAGARPKGRDRQLHRESQGRAEDLLSGTSVHYITMTVSNNQWWAAEEVVSVVHEEQMPWCDGSIKNKYEESGLSSDQEGDNCRKDDNDDTPDSSQESVNEEVMRRPVWVEREKQEQVFSKSQLSRQLDERRHDEYPPEKMNEWSRMCEWQRKTCENRLRHPTNAQRIGEAKNPGPQERRNINDKIEGKLWSCNTGGASGVFRMITKLQTMTGQKPLVVAMQEPKLSEASHKAVAALAYSTGFFSYHAESKPHKGRWEGEERLQGGLLTLVRTDLQQRLVQKASESDAQVLAVEVAGTIMINVCSPPERCREELATLLCLTTEALRIGPAQPAMWMGDWNETEEDRAVAVLRKYGASVTTDTDPGATTRFSSDKKFDYYVTNDINSTGPMRRKADKISDHMIIELPWQTEKKYQDCTVTLEPVPKWHNPGMTPTSEWRMLISNTWIDSPKWPGYTT